MNSIPYKAGEAYCFYSISFYYYYSYPFISDEDALPGDALLKLDLQITQQKVDSLDKTTSCIKEEHGSSGSSSPEIWEPPTIPLVSIDNKTESVTGKLKK